MPAAWTASAEQAIEPLARALDTAHQAAGVAAARADVGAASDKHDENEIPWLRVRVLAPLRTRDVKQAATERGVTDSAVLVQDLENRELGVLAARPLTLGFLLDGYMNRQGLPPRGQPRARPARGADVAVLHCLLNLPRRAHRRPRKSAAARKSKQ